MIRRLVLQMLKTSVAILVFSTYFASIASCIEIPLSDVDDLLHLSLDQNESNDQQLAGRKIEDYNPVVDVQSVLSDGIGWEGSMGFETAYQVIITVSGTDPDSKSFLPFSSIPVAVRLDEGYLRCVVENGNGNGKFTKCDLSSKPVIFWTNMLGRVSFSLPIPGLYDGKKQLAALPALMIRTDFMPKASWIAAHADDDAHFKLSKLEASTLRKLNPALGIKSAKEIAFAISHILQASQKKTPFLHLDSSKKLIKRGHTYEHPSLIGDGSLEYDGKLNRLSTYQLMNVSESSSDRIVERSFVVDHSSTLKKRSLDNHDSVEWIKECKTLMRRDYVDGGEDPDIIAGDDNHFWSLWSYSKGKYMALFKDSIGRVYSKMIDKVSDIWNFINLVLVGSNVVLEEVLDFMRSIFDFDDVLNTQKFLSSYYMLLIPLGFRSYEISKENTRDLFLSYTKLIKNMSDNVFGSNMSISEYETWSKTLLDGPSTDGIRFASYGIPNHEKIIPKEIPKNILHSSDGLTHSMLDRIVNNIPHISIIDPAENFNSSAFSRLYILLKEAVKIIAAKVPASILHNLLYMFKDLGSIRDFKIGVLINILQKLMMASSQTFFLVWTSLSHFLPIYWNTVTQIITMPIRIPFVYDWFTKRLTDGKSDLTLSDLLTLFGGTVATWTYKLYNENYPPYTSTDIEVLQSNSEPELILYTWGNDPRTSDKGDNITHVHRLGILDWIPKMHQLALGTFASLAVDLPTAMLAENITHAPPAVVKAQSFTVLVNIMTRAGYYPFTQLDTNDPEKIAHSKRYPDKRYLTWWLTQIFGDFYKLISFLLPIKFSSYPFAEMFNLAVVTAPGIAFGLRVQIDSVRQVSKINDLARKVAVHISWINQVFAWIGSIIPFCKKPKQHTTFFGYTINPPIVLSSKTLRWFQFGRDGLNFVANLARNHIMMSNHIVGLLSSSYQGTVQAGSGKRREVIELENMKLLIQTLGLSENLTMELSISSRVDKGFSKAPKLVPRVRPRVKVVEEPKKILKVAEQTMPAVEEEVVDDFQQESEEVNSIKLSGNIITIPQMITPEVIVAPTVSDCPIIMKDLIKSKFCNGQLSKLESIRRQMISEKRKGRLKEEIKAPEPEAAPEEDEIQAPRGPQIRLVNGEIVIDENSLMVAQEREKIEFQRVEEDATRYVSSASFRIRKKTGRVKWTQELTDQFYDGLSYFGTDFGLVALLFPGFSRNMIKLKYNLEERANGTRVSQALMNRKVPGDDLKMQMKHNLTINLEKEEVTNTATKISRNSSKAKARGEDSPDNVNQTEKADQTDQEPSTVETVQPTTTIVEKAFQETAQKSFEDAIDNIQALSSSFSKPGQVPKIAPRVSKRPPRKVKSGSIDEQ